MSSARAARGRARSPPWSGTWPGPMSSSSIGNDEHVGRPLAAEEALVERGDRRLVDEQTDSSASSPMPARRAPLGERTQRRGRPVARTARRRRRPRRSPTVGLRVVRPTNDRATVASPRAQSRPIAGRCCGLASGRRRRRCRARCGGGRRRPGRGGRTRCPSISPRISSRPTQARAAAGDVDLGDVAGDDRLGAEADPGEEHLHLLGRGVLRLVEDDEARRSSVRPRMNASGATSIVPRSRSRWVPSGSSMS